METYTNFNGETFPYALGFSSHMTKEQQMFYIDKDLNHNKLFVDCFRLMLTEKYRGHTFFVHNLAGFDIVYIMKFLNPYILNETEYKVDLIAREDAVISIKISQGRN